MSPYPTVSIGLPVYNGEQFIDEAIKSVLRQSYTDFELVISDNASTDRTQEICSEYADQDDRIRYVGNVSNRGAAWNFNRVFELSRGPYFKWINHDDCWDPVMLERSVSILETAPSGVVLCYPKTVFMDECGSITEYYEDKLDLRYADPAQRLGSLIRNLRRCNSLFGLMRARDLERTRLLGAYIDADRTLLAELSMLGQFWELDEHLFMRRMHPKGSTFANTTRQESMSWWNPAKKQNQLHLPNWRLLMEHVRGIQHVPLRSGDRRRCYVSLGRHWPTMYSRRMVGDLKAVTYRMASGVR